MDGHKVRIVGFAQLHNELAKNNLENFMRSMQLVCDHIYIFDQASDDGSREYYKQFDNLDVIYSETNRFIDEGSCKQELLSLIKQKEEPGTWIFWMDGDTVPERKMLDKKYLRKKIQEADWESYDAVITGHYNLWRSDLFYRIDNKYHHIHTRVDGNTAFWKLSDNIRFLTGPGLHKKPYPQGLKRSKREEFSLIHRGFATDDQIITRYKIYKDRGQKGDDLERLLDEQTLQVVKIDPQMYPEWIKVSHDNPVNKQLVREIYNASVLQSN